MNCGSFLPLADQQPTQANLLYPAAGPPAASFVPPSEAARQTGGLNASPPENGYLRYARPTGQTDQLTVTPPAGYIASDAPQPRYTAPIAPPNAAPQSQAAMWMSDNAGPEYYYPPTKTATVVQQQSSFGLYIAAAIVALIVVAGAAGFLLWGLPGNAANGTSGGSANSAPGAATPAAPNAQSGAAGAIQKCNGQQADCLAVKAAIDGSNQDQIDSLKTLKTDSLKNHTTGSELNNHIQDVMDLQSKGLYYDTKLEHIDYLDVTIVSDSEATAKTVESWSGKLYDQKTNQLLGSQPATTLHETYHFVKQNGNWLVDKVTIAEDQQNGQPTPPDNSQ